jgi:hypothetical protein
MPPGSTRRYMPRYFFDIVDGIYRIDDQGTLLADDREALLLAAQIARELIADGEDYADAIMLVRNESGTVLWQGPMAKLNK